MLDGCAAALVCLYTARHGRCHLAGHQRILGVILKIAPATDRMVDVQRWGKPQMHAEALHALIIQSFLFCIQAQNNIPYTIAKQTKEQYNKIEEGRRDAAFPKPIS